MFAQRMLITGLLAGTIVMAAAPAVANDADEIREYMAIARLSMIDAIRIAEAQTGGQVYRAEFAESKGRIYYKLRLVVGGEKIRTEVDARVVPVRVPPPPPERRYRIERLPQSAQPEVRQPAAEAPPAQRGPEPIAPAPQPETRGGVSQQLEKPAPSPATSLPATGIIIPFDSESAGSAPTGFSPAETAGKGSPATWRIVAADDAPTSPNVVTAISTTEDPSTFSVLVANQPVLADVEVGAKVKMTSGRPGTGAGLVWRYQDPDNYYVASYEPVGNTVTIWRIKDGRRKRLQTGEAAEVPPGGWRQIRVEMEDEKITAWLDGEQVAEVKDYTFVEPGRVGFWINGDATASFDSLTVADLSM